MYALATTGPTPWLVLCGIPAGILVASAIAAVLTRVARGYPALSDRWPAPIAARADRASEAILVLAWSVLDRVRPLPDPADDATLAPVVELRRDEHPKIA